MNAHKIPLTCKRLNLKIDFCKFFNLFMQAITPSYIHYDVELTFKPLSQGTKALK